MTKQQMLDALDGLVQRCEQLGDKFVKDLQPWTPEFVAWLKACESTIEVIFGSNSHALLGFKGIHFQPPPSKQYASESQAGQTMLLWFMNGLHFACSTLVGHRYAVERLAEEEPARPSPYIFISHGGPTRTHVDAVRDFIAALGLSPIIVADQPNLNLSLHEKVRLFMDICSGAVVLATEEDETLAQEKRTRPNVEHEVGMLQVSQYIGGRIIYLKEAGVQFASNYDEKVWIPFDKSRAPEAFIDIARELRAFGFIGPG